MQRIQQAIADDKLAGCVYAVVDRDRVLLEGALGFADREAGRPAAVDDLFFIASTSKALAATAILTVVPLEEVRRLLSHTAGVFPNSTKDAAQAGLTRDPNRTLAEAAEAIAAQPLAFPAGEGAAYSDAGFFLAGRQAEVATGLEFHEVLRARLTEPLGMPDTFYRAPRDVSARLAVMYHRSPAGLKRAGLQQKLREGGLIKVGSGIVSCARDLARFLQLHLRDGENLLPRELALEMRRDQTGGRWKADPMGGENSGYGLGWQLGDPGIFFHAGAFGSLIWADAQRGRGVVLLAQTPIHNVYDLWRKVIPELVAT